MGRPKPGAQSRSYVLRCWIEDGHPADGPRDWRFSLQDVTGATRHGFTSLAALLAFLADELERSPRTRAFTAAAGAATASLDAAANNRHDP